jgi:hypothetical protein
MMSIKDLFNKKNYSQISKGIPLSSASLEAEGTAMIEAKRKQFDRFIPPINFGSASAYAKFGSAEMYYENAFKRIYQQYPYDGTLAEKTEFENSSSFLDRYVFDNIYPRTNGYAVFSAQGTAHTAVAGGGGFSRPTTAEYIYIQGGPHTASGGMVNKKFANTFDNSMVYSVVSGSKKGSSLETNMVSGSTIEFWMKKGTFVSGNAKQVIFDMWNGMRNQDHNDDYGRLTLMLSRSTNAGDKPFSLTLRSGSSGFNNLALGSSQASSSVMDNNWHHYAITIQSASGNSLKAELYIDGDLDYAIVSAGNYIPEVPIKTSGLNAYLGALVTSSLDNTATRAGDGKLSASLDDFRFWKVARTPEQINHTWNIPIGGGTNKHDSNKDLGVYYKFNEGITATSSTDSIVLDYSGRICNGEWTGYASASRRTTSAFVESGKVAREFKDPIIYSYHPDVTASIRQYRASGSLADKENSSMFYSLFPAWMQETDTQNGKQLKKLSQIISSYFDTLWHQINFLNKMHDREYITGSSKALPFAKNLLQNNGFMMPDLFVDASIAERFMKKNESHVFEKELIETKNLIYQNIYNNLSFIYKSKGTEKSFRNFFRAVGINSDLVKLKMYADDSTYVLRDNLQLRSLEKNYINFNTEFNMGGTIFQTSSSADKANSFIHSGSEEMNKAFTIETEIVLPLKNNIANSNYFTTNFLTASIVGLKFPNSNPDVFTQASGSKDIHIIVARDKFDHQLYDGDFQTVRFGISSSHNSIGVQYGPRVYNQYKDNKWNLSLTFKDQKYPYTSFVSGNVTTPPTYDVCLYGIETDGTISRNNFKLETTSTASVIVGGAKRLYAGAHRTDYTGQLLLNTDIKLGSVRYWQCFVPTGAIAQHAFDPDSYGSTRAFMPDTIMNTSASIPRADMLVLHWAFDNMTGSGPEGQLKVFDLSSGSYSDSSLAKTYGEEDTRLLKSMHMGRGFGFLANSTSSISKEYLYSAKKSQPDDIYSSDLVKIKDNSSENFFIDDDVSDNFYSFEKSLYGVISQEMLNMFATVKDFANIIGQPNQKYHSKYGRLNQLRDLFFEDVENDPDIEKFTRFYKWIDDSISTAIAQLIPASTRFSNSINNMVESHVLERNKYANRVGLLTRRESTEGSIKGVSELLYDWESGHAPVGYKPFTKAIGSILLAANPSDGETIVISDGTTSVTFTFKNSATADTHVELDSSAEDTTTELISVINSTTSLNVTAKRSGLTLVLLENDNFGSAGNVDITETMANAANITLGMYGGGVTEADQKQNCLWWSDRAKTPEVGGHASSINTMRDVVNNHSLQSSGLTRRKVDGTAYFGSTYAIRKLSKPYNLSAIQKRTIHGGVNFSTPINKLFMLESVAPFGTQATVPNNVITVGVGPGTTGISSAKICNDKKQPTEKFKFAIEAQVGKNSDDASGYSHNMKGNRIFPFNFVSGTVHTGYNAETKKNYRNDVIITNLHSDITDYSNEIPMQGPFTETHVGGHQSRHVSLNSVNVENTLMISGSSGGAFATALIRFTSSNNSLVSGDSVTVTDFYDTTVKADFGSHYDLLNNKWTSALELKEILEAKLEVNVSIVTSAGASSATIKTLNITQKEIGAGGNSKALTGSSNNGAIHTVNFAGGSNPSFSAGRNVNLNDNEDRPEAFAIVMKEHPVLLDADGAFGVVPADYGNTTHPAGTLQYNVNRPRATRYRDEHAKRPVNIRNIQYNTGSSVVGNFRNGREIVMLNGTTQKRWYKSNNTTHLPSDIQSNLPDTTNYLTLMNQTPFLSVGNIFGVDNSIIPTTARDGQWTSARHPDGASFFDHFSATGHVAIDRHTNPANGPGTITGISSISFTRGDGVTYFFRFSTSNANGTTFGSNRYYVQVTAAQSADAWYEAIINLMDTMSMVWNGTAINTIRTSVENPNTFSKNGQNVGLYISAGLNEGTEGGGEEITKSEALALLGNNNVRVYINITERQLQGNAGNRTSWYNNSHPSLNDYLSGSQNINGGGSRQIDPVDRVIQVPTGSKSTYEIKSRFSAPGGPEVQSTGYLDAVSHTFSPHNSLNFRNLSVLNDSGENNAIRIVDHLNKRRGLRSLLAVHQGRGGLDSEFLTVLSASNYGISGSYVKQHRNTSRRMQFSGESIITGSKNDNGYFSSTIPRSDFQYGWINAAITGSNFRNKQRVLGHAPSSGLVTSSVGMVAAIVFPTSSHLRSN